MSRIANRRITGGLGGSTVDTSLRTAVVPMRRLVVDSRSVANPETLARHLNEMQSIVEEVTAASRSNPEAGAIIIGPFTGAAQLSDVAHHLGRAPVSVTCARAIGAAWTGYEVAATDIDGTKVARIQFPMTGTFYLRFA